MAYRVGIDIGFDTSGAKGTVQALADQAKSILSNIGGAVGLDTSGLVKATDAVKKVSKDLNLDLKLEPLDLNRLGLGKLQEALEKTGQLGKPLSKIRFGDKKEYAEANRQLLDMRRNMEAINRTGFGHEVNRRAAILGPDAKNPFGWDWEKMYQGDVREAGRQRERFWGKALSGKDTEPPKTPETPTTLSRQAANAPSYGRYEGQAEPRGPGLLRRAAGWAWHTGANVLGTAAGLGGVGSIVGGILTAYREHQSVTQSAESIYRKALTGQTFEDIEQNFRELGRQLQLSAADAGRLSASFVEASGRIEAGTELSLGAGRFGRGYGMDPIASAQQFGRAALVGYGSDKGAQREFAGLLAATIADSSMLARPMQVMEDLVGHVSEIADREGRTATAGEVGGFAQFMADLYRDNPALRGGGAQNIVQGLNQFGAGGDMQKEAMAWAAFSTTGRRDFIEFEKFKDQNVFDVVDGRTKLERLMDIAKKEAALFPGSAQWQDKMAYVLKTQTGMSMPLAESAMDALSKLGHKGGGIAGMQNWLRDVAGKGLGETNPEAFANLTRLYQGGSADYRALAQQYVTGYDQLNDNEKFRAKISQEQRDQLEKLLKSGNDAELKNLLPGLVASSGAANNPAEAARKATADLANVLESNIGPGMQDLVRWLSTTGADGIRQTTDLAKNVLPGLKASIEGLTGAIVPILEKLGIVTHDQAGSLETPEQNEYSTWSDQYADPESDTEPKGWFGRAEKRLGHFWSGYTKAMDKVLRRHGKPTRQDMAQDIEDVKSEWTGPEGTINRGARAWRKFWREGFSDIGDISAHYEGDYGTVSSGAGDPGGASYGRYQFSSKTGGLRKFFNANPRYAKAFDGLIPGTPEFSNKWRELSSDPDFRKAQDVAARERWFEPAAKMAKELGFKVGNLGVKQSIFSGSIQHGNISKILQSAASRAGFSDMSPMDQIKAFYDARADYIRSLSIPKRTKSNILRNRYPDEVNDALMSAEVAEARNAKVLPSIRPATDAGEIAKSPAPPIVIQAPSAPPLPTVDNKPLPVQVPTPKVDFKMPPPPKVDIKAPPALTPPKVDVKAPPAPKVDVKVNVPTPPAPALSTLPIPKVPEVPTPKTPEKLEKVSQSLTQQQPANARLDGQVEMALILQNERGQELHRRTGIMVSEPMIHGSGGSNNFVNRFIWQDTSVVS